MLSLAGLQHGGQLLGPSDEDQLVCWVAVIMIALQLVGVPLAPEVSRARKPAGWSKAFASQQVSLPAETSSLTAVLPPCLQGEERMRQLGRENPADDQTGLIAGLRVSFA